MIFGLGALGVSFSAIASLVRHRAAALATTAAVAGGLGAFCGAIVNVLIGLNLAAAAKTHASTSAAAVLVAQNRATASKLLFGLYLGGLLTATLLAGIALWRSNAVHRGVAALFVVGLVLAASSPPSVIALPLLLPFVLAAVLLAKRIWDVAAVTTEASRIDQPA